MAYLIALRRLRQGRAGPGRLGGGLGQIDRLGQAAALPAQAVGPHQKPHAHGGAQGEYKQIQHQLQQKEVGSGGAPAHTVTSPVFSSPVRGATQTE